MSGKILSAASDLKLGEELAAVAQELLKNGDFRAALPILYNANKHFRNPFIEGAQMKEGLKLNLLEKIAFYDKCIVKCFDSLGQGTSKNAKEKENEEIAEQLLKCIAKDVHKTSLKDVIGYDDVIIGMKESIFLPAIFPTRFSSRCRGILLFGPSGVGKTLIIKALVGEFNRAADNMDQITVWKIGLGDLMQRYVGETEKFISTLFELAANRKPSIICIDEIDSIISRREDTDSDSSGRMKTCLLSCMDGLSQNEGIIVVGTTNRPQIMDDAFFSRFQKRFYIGLPDKKSREQIMIKAAKEMGEIDDEMDFEQIAKYTDGYSGRDLVNIITEANSRLFRGHFSAKDMTDVKRLAEQSLQLKQLKLSMKDVWEALQKTNKSNDFDTMRRLEDWATTNASNTWKQQEDIPHYYNMFPGWLEPLIMCLECFSLN